MVKRLVNGPDLDRWYTGQEALEKLRKDSGRDLSESYHRKLAAVGKVRTFRISNHNVLYYKADVDGHFTPQEASTTALPVKRAVVR